MRFESGNDGLGTFRGHYLVKPRIRRVGNSAAIAETLDQFVLDLREDEIESLTRELGAILEAVSKVAELDLADVPPTSHPLDLVNVWADDEPRPSLSLGDALANAPAREGDLFRARIIVPM